MKLIDLLINAKDVEMVVVDVDLGWNVHGKNSDLGMMLGTRWHEGEVDHFEIHDNVMTVYVEREDLMPGDAKQEAGKDVD